MDDEVRRVAALVATAAHSRDHTVAAAESVTAGSIATALASAPDASEWFLGSVVAYATRTKRDVLGVTAPQLISWECAEQLARGVLERTGADLAVAVTGVGGPDPEEDRPPGTVFICAASRRRSHVFEHGFDGDPAEVVRLSTLHALRHLQGVAMELHRGE